MHEEAQPVVSREVRSDQIKSCFFFSSPFFFSFQKQKTRFQKQRLYLHLSTLRNHYVESGLVIWSALHVLHFPHDEEPITKDSAEDHVLIVEPVALAASDEELTSVCVCSAVCHGKQSRSSVPRDEVLVLESRSIDARASCSVPFQEVTSLDHEVLDDSVELAGLISNRLSTFPVLARAKLPEVLTSAWANVSEELHLDPPSINAANLHVEEHDRIARVLRSRVPVLNRRRHSLSLSCAALFSLSLSLSLLCSSLKKREREREEIPLVFLLHMYSLHDVTSPRENLKKQKTEKEKKEKKEKRN